MSFRIESLISRLKSSRLDAFLVTHPVNLLYLCGIRLETSALFITSRGNFILTDGRFAEACSRLNGFEIIEIGDSFITRLKKLTKDQKLKRVGFESSHIAHGPLEAIKRRTEKVKWVGTKSWVEEGRRIKDDKEIYLIKEACKILRSLFSKIPAIAKAGKSELCIAREIDRVILKEGGLNKSFDTIVTQPPASSMPHASPTSRRISASSCALIDTGVQVNGYNSDLTRVFFLGKIDRKFVKIYRIICEAQRRAIALIKDGVRARTIDKAARKFLENKGLGSYFKHSLGHGIGLEVHEEPRIGPKSDTILKSGMVITIEPGVYIPGWGGLRREDMVLVGKNGCEVLTAGIE